LPGKSLAILDQQTNLVLDLIPCEDGHAQERLLLDKVLLLIKKGQLWVADRNFCTAALLAGIDAREAYFVIRRHKGLPLRTVGRKRLFAKLQDGTKLYEQEIVIWDDAGEPIQVRLVTVRRKQSTRDGDYKIEIVTNLPLERADALHVSRIYAARWSLETAFQKLADVLRCEVNMQGYPRAALFAFATAVTSFNVMATIEGALRATHGVERIRDELSIYHLTQEISDMHWGIARLANPTNWTAVRALSGRAFVRLLLDMAGRLDMNRLKKSRRGPKKPVTPKTRFRNTPHVSTAKILRASRE
jgi:hypothetical protein